MRQVTENFDYSNLRVELMKVARLDPVTGANPEGVDDTDTLAGVLFLHYWNIFRVERMGAPAHLLLSLEDVLPLDYLAPQALALAAEACEAHYALYWEVL